MPKSEKRKDMLALNGGIPARTKPWKDNFTTNFKESLAASRVISTGYLSSFEGSYTPDPPFSFSGGKEVQLLEKEFGDHVGVEHVVSMNSATSGLYAAIGALGIGYGDEVIVSPFTMTACALAPLLYGAIPIFADVDPQTGCLDAKSIVQRINSRTKAILIVHQFGIPADMASIMAIAAKHSLRVIEDCAQAHGAKFQGRPVGTFGDVGIFSLNVNKAIQSGEGGLCVTRDEELSYRLKLIRNHGEAVVGPAGYENIVNILGFNYRMTEVTAAIARSQLKKLRKLNQHRLKLVGVLKQGVERMPWLRFMEGNSSYCDCGGWSEDCCIATYYLTPFTLDYGVVPVSRSHLANAMKAEGVSFSYGYVKPLYFQPVYQTKLAFKFGYPFSALENEAIVTNYESGSCPVAEDLHFNRLLVSEHIRWPHGISDVRDVLCALRKYDSWLLSITGSEKKLRNK